MAIQKVNNGHGSKGVGKTALAGGALAAGVKYAMLPAETKGAFKATILRNQDSFVKKAQKCAKKTMKDTGKTFDMGKIAENAKGLYPGMKETAKTTAKKLGKTFGVAAVIAGGAKLVYDLAAKNKEAKKA